MPSGLKVSGLQKGRFMIDRKAFRSLSSGLYLITAKAGDARCGCVVNTLVQVASEPATLSVSLNKENATTAAILESGRRTLHGGVSDPKRRHGAHRHLRLPHLCRH